MPTYGVAQTVAKLQADVGELISAASDAASPEEDFREFADEPLRFIREICGEEPTESQVRIIESVLHNPLTCVTSGTGFGKDWCVGRLCLWSAICRGQAVRITAPTSRQARDVVMLTEIANAMRAAAANGKPLPGALHSLALKLPGRAAPAIQAVVASSTSNFTGLHHPQGVLVVLTEAQGIDSSGLEGALSVSVGEHDKVLAVGNPVLDSSDWFREAANEGSQWHSIILGSHDHPNIALGLKDGDPEFIPGGPSLAWIERMRNTYGSEHPTFVSRVLGQFPKDGLNAEALFERPWINASVERHARVTQYLDGRIPSDRSTSGGWPNFPFYAVGVDVASAAGKTVVCVASGSYVIAFHEWTGASIPDGVARLSKVLRSYGLEPDDTRYSLNIDNTGIGPGFTDLVAEEGWSQHRTHFGGKAPRGPSGERFLNLRAYMYWSLALRLRRGLISIPPGTWREELLATYWRATSEDHLGATNGLQLVSKKKISRALGRSPDMADALILAMAQMHAATGSTSFMGVSF